MGNPFRRAFCLCGGDVSSSDRVADSQSIQVWVFFMSRKVYVAGKLVPAEQASVSVFDHGLLYGDGIFEGIRVYGGRVFLLREHIDRLYESALAIRLEIPLPRT